MLNTVRLFLICIMGLILPLWASAESEGSSPIHIELLQEEETVQPGRPFWIALHLTLEEGWHVYWKNPGDAGIPLKIEWKLPAGFEIGPLQWPYPEKFIVADMVGFGYQRQVTLMSQVFPSPDITGQEKHLLQAQIQWLACSPLTCQPGTASVHLPLVVASHAPQLRFASSAIFEQARSKLPQTSITIKPMRKQGIVQLEIPQKASLSSHTIVRGVDFFPEQSGVIDHTIEPTFALSSAQRYLVHLKEDNETEIENQHLKGVLVFYTQSGTQEDIQAFEINSPIEEESHEQVASLFGSHSSSFASVGSNHAFLSSSPTSEGKLGLALIFAFLGGMLLNLMPCVLPVLSFKVMSFVKMAGHSRTLTLKHGVLFSLGVIFSFWILASIMLMLRSYGQAVGWGFQLQEPLFVVILASVLFIFALNLFGLFEWGMFFASWAGQTQVATKQKTSSYMGSFLSGVLATAVATPCTGPFLGSAVGFAVTLPFFSSLLIFTFLGLGMCFPYLLLAAFPSYLRFIPKPGPWMETFKQLMGFLLLATVLWLLWVFSAQTNTLSLICLLAGFLCFAIAAWIYGRCYSPFIKRATRAIAYTLVLGLIIIGCQLILIPKASWDSGTSASLASAEREWEGWEDFSPTRVAELRREGKPILIDFTAKWCLICQANHLVLNSEKVKKTLNRAGVVKMKADWTRSDPAITEALRQFGRNSVPLYVLYGPHQEKEPLILPQVLTADTVLAHIKTATAKKEIALN